MTTPSGTSDSSGRQDAPIIAEAVQPDTSTYPITSAGSGTAIQLGPHTKSGPPVQNSSESRPRVSLPRPACTHTIMDRVYGNFICQICHQPPQLGFVYFCQQDLVHGPVIASAQLPFSKTHLFRHKKLQKGASGSKERHQSISMQLQVSGFNQSVVKAAAEGHYTQEQIQMLRSQKTNVKNLIQESFNQRESLISGSGPSAATPKDKLATPTARSTLLQDTVEISGILAPHMQRAKTRARPTLPAKSPLAKAFQTCDYRVCHTCRPLFRDRCFTSFEAAYTGEIWPLKEWMPQLMPVVPASLVRSLGLRQPLARTLDEPSSTTTSPSPEQFRVSSSKGETTSDANDDFDVGHAAHPSRRLREFNRNSASEDLKSLLHIQKHVSTEDLKSSQLPHDKSSAKDIEDINRKFDTIHPSPPTEAFALGSGQEGRSKDMLAPSTIKPQPSSTGFRASLAKDMRDIIERAYREVQGAPAQSLLYPPSRTDDATAIDGFETGTSHDALTGLDASILSRLVGRYGSSTSASRGLATDREIFDLRLWKALSDSILERAAATPLPGEDGADELDRDLSVGQHGVSKDDHEFGAGADGSARRNTNKSRMSTKLPFPRMSRLGIVVDGAQGEEEAGLVLELKMKGLAIDGAGNAVSDRCEVGDEGVMGVALTEEAAENGSPDVITSELVNWTERVD